MPYDTLPARYRDLIPAEDGQDIFRRTINSQLAAGKTEAIAFASAWAALERAGYEKGDDGKWMKKTMPTASQVHVPGAEWDDEKGRGKKPKGYMEKASGAAPIYMYRPVMNAEQLHEWAAAQGFTSALPLDDMHVTVVFSKAAFNADLSRVAEVNGVVRHGNIVVRGGKRAVVALGDKGAVVLKIQSDALQYEHMMFREMGASWDYQEYTPHISITYQGRDLPLIGMEPFMGDIVLGPLYAKPMNTNWDSEIVEVSLAMPKVEKAEYRGRTVALDKPFRLPKGSSKKFGVYVKDGDRVKRVTFGDPNMEIRRDDPEARANFRARHSCDTATDKTSARYWSCRMWSAGASVGELTKRGLNDDIFTTAVEAAVRGMELGLNGEVHVHQTADGQAVYMPGDSHETYLERMAELGGATYDHEDDEEDAEGDSEGEGLESDDEDSEGLLDRVISGMLRAAMAYDMNKSAEVLKLDSERRIAWGWASVSTVNGKLVTDTQGDVITPTELGKMADRFMASARTAKAMHEGDQIGEVLHSLPLTNELAKAFGINTDREGWLIGMKIYDDAVWKGFQEGRYRAFSIGGRAKRG